MPKDIVVSQLVDMLSSENTLNKDRGVHALSECVQYGEHELA